MRKGRVRTACRLTALALKTFSEQIAYVFDSTKSADEVLKTLPLSKWLTSNHPVIRAQIGNVIIVAAPAGKPDQARRIRRAIAALRAS